MRRPSGFGEAYPGFALSVEVLSLACPRVPVLFFAPPKKSTKRKAGPVACPLTRVPCASRYFERSPDSQHLPRLRLANPARQGGSLTLKIPAMLGSANGNGVPPPCPVALTEYRSQSGKRRAACLRQVLWGRLADPIKLRVVRAPGLARNAGHRRQPMSAPGAILFGYFLLAKQEKVPRHSWRKM